MRIAHDWYFHQRNMGADFCYAYVIIEVDRELALQRLNKMTLAQLYAANRMLVENAIENDTVHDWENYAGPEDVYSQEGLDYLSLDILPGIKESVIKYINLAYDLWEGKTLSRVVSKLKIRGIEALITGDTTWGDGWEELEAFITLGALRITEFDY